MLQVVSRYWSFLPYLALVGFLTIMSVIEKPGKMDVKKTRA